MSTSTIPDETVLMTKMSSDFLIHTPPSTLNSTWPIPKSIIEREYKILYLSEGQSLPYINTCVRNDLYFHLHLSGITVLGLAHTHPIITQNLTIVNIKWKKLDQNNQKIQLSGKRKTGAINFSPDDTVCMIECDNGIEYHIKPYIRGRLIEINPSFPSQPTPIDNTTNTSQKGQQNNKRGGKHNHNNKQKQQQQKQEEAIDTTSTTTTTPTTTTTTTTTTPTTADNITSTPQQPLVPIYDQQLLEQYKLLKTDPHQRGYLCMFLLSPEQMQLMLRLFLSTRDFNELIIQRKEFYQNNDLTHMHIPFVPKALDLKQPSMIINFHHGPPVLAFKKGEFKIKNGVYKNIYTSIQLEAKRSNNNNNSKGNNVITTTTTTTSIPPPPTTTTTTAAAAATTTTTTTTEELLSMEQQREDEQIKPQQV